ncbi:MAG: acyl-CoA dehydrogenase [Candidatus Lernaella stagnicola]|nr:acyl-CoA dehydrogenase [Candidatus Lernaella stagnicola]
MHFEFNDECRALQDMVRDFAEKELKPNAAEWDEKHEFPVDVVKKMGELGLMGVPYDVEYNGAGMDYLAYAIVVEELSRGCGGTGVICSAHTSLACDPIYNFGTEEQKQKFLSRMTTAEWIGCFGLTEAGAGSDAGSLTTVAEKQGDEWVINGAKLFITNGKEASVAIVFATTDRSMGYKGQVALIVPSDAPGYSVGKVEDKMGIRATSTTELVFENCRVPVENQLGEVGQGFKIALGTLDGGRIGIAAQAVGIAQAALDECIKYSKERVQFGKPLAKMQAIQWMIADMGTEIEAARLLTYRAAWMKANKVKGFSKFSAMAKLFAAEACMRATTKAIQIHGGYGYTKEYPVERHFRDAKITEIYEGTSEIQRLVIASTLLRD